MNRMTTLCLAVLLTLAAASPAALSAAAQSVFTGEISDSMCGLKHMMPGGAKACTEECIKSGSKYVLADKAHRKVYQLSDQQKAGKFPGEKVRVTGRLKGDTIEVSSITPVK